MRNVLSVLAMMGLLAACSDDGPGEGGASAAASPAEAQAESETVNGGSSGSTTPSSVECSVDAECNHLGEATFCGASRCVAGKCVREVLQPIGTKLPSQRYGDCNAAVCDGNGGITQAPDDADVYSNSNPCIVFECSAGKASSSFQAAGYLCNGGTLCDGKGSCVACNADVDCSYKGAGGTCIDHQCVSAACKNGMKDPGESDIDCAGNCPKCVEGKSCTFGPQCASGVCAAGKCAAPTCTDGVKNGDETAADCGGSCPGKCALDLGCALPSDCASGVCMDGFCAPE